MIRAMHLVLAGVSPHQAALREQIAVSTMYRSSLYKLWRQGTVEARSQLKQQLITDNPVKRTKKLA
jgi:uncharacterized membrane protein YfcA